MSVPLFAFQPCKRRMRAVLIGSVSGWFVSVPAHINRIKGLLFGQGIRGVEPARKRTRIDLSELRTGEGLPLPDRLRAELEREYTRFDLVEQQLKAVEAERDTADAQDPTVERKRGMLIQLRGVGPASAAILAREIFCTARSATADNWAPISG